MGNEIFGFRFLRTMEMNGRNEEDEDEDEDDEKKEDEKVRNKER